MKYRQKLGYGMVMSSYFQWQRFKLISVKCETNFVVLKVPEKLLEVDRIAFNGKKLF